MSLWVAPGNAGLQQHHILFRIEPDVAKHSPRRKVRERSEAADSHPLPFERFHSSNLGQRRKLVFNNSQAPDDYDIRAAECGSNPRRAGGGQDLYFAGDEGLNASRSARDEKQLGVDSVARKNSRFLSQPKR
jgi:hypothetical protein